MQPAAVSEIEVAGDAAPVVVGEDVGTDVAGGVEVLGQLVDVLGVAGVALGIRGIGHGPRRYRCRPPWARSTSTAWRTTSRRPAALRRRRRSRSATASTWRWSAPTASARPRCSAWSPVDDAPTAGTITVDGRLGVMDQLVGMRGEADGPVRDLFVSLAPPADRRRGRRARRRHPRRRAGRRRRQAVVRRQGRACAWPRPTPTGARSAATRPRCCWNVCATEAVGLDLDEASARPLATFSGGQQKRLALEYLLRNDDDVLLLDEPDNFLDIPGKRWLEARLQACRKTILFISHDRELLARAAHRIVTIEGDGAWTHGGSFTDYADARLARLEKLEDDHQRWMDERKRLADNKRIMKERAKVSDANVVTSPSRRDPPASLRRAGPAARATQRPEDHHAPRRWPHRQASDRHRGSRAGRPHVPVVRPRSGSASASACWATTAPASPTCCACWPATRRSPTRAGASSAPGSCPATSARPTTTPSWSGRTLLDDPPVARPQPGPGDVAPDPLRAARRRPTRPSRRCRAVSRPASRSCCSSSAAAPSCCSTSPPTTSTSPRPRRSNRPSPRSRAPSSPSPTTAGS